MCFTYNVLPQDNAASTVLDLNRFCPSFWYLTFLCTLWFVGHFIFSIFFSFNSQMQRSRDISHFQLCWPLLILVNYFVQSGWRFICNSLAAWAKISLFYPEMHPSKVIGYFQF